MTKNIKEKDDPKVSIVNINKTKMITAIRDEINKINDSDFVSYNISFEKLIGDNKFQKNINLTINKFTAQDAKNMLED